MDLLACLGKAALLCFRLTGLETFLLPSQRELNGFCSSMFHFGIDMLMF